MSCIWCGVRRDYYLTPENASRQNCRASDNGYHDFSEYTWCIRMWNRVWPRRRLTEHERLMRHRHERRPHTI
mgnify:CR=1 FL=1